MPVSYQSTVQYEGRPCEIAIPDLLVPKCKACGEVVFDNAADDQISQALRAKLGLLRPDQIRAGRNQLGLSERDFAAFLGVAEESLTCWENGAQIQSRIVDRQIRLFFEFPAVREALSQLQQGRSVGETVATEAA